MWVPHTHELPASPKWGLYVAEFALNGGCTVLGDIHCQAGQDSEHPDGAVGVFIAGELDQITFKGPFQLNNSVIL